MKAGFRKILTGFLMAALICSLTGCDLFKDFDASGYVKAYMNALIKGDAEELAEFTKESKDEIREDYEKLFNAQVEGVKSQFSSYKTGLTKDQEKRLEKITETYYKDAKFEVKEAEKIDKKHFKVQVVITPMSSPAAEDSPIMIFSEDFPARAQAGEFNEMERAQIEEIAIEGLITAMEDYVDNPTYEDKKTIVLNVKADDSNHFAIEDGDFRQMMFMMFELSSVPDIEETDEPEKSEGSKKAEEN